MFDIRAICRLAILSNATSIIIAHNHPSGDATPSTADVKMTGMLKTALRMFTIKLTDALVFTNDFSEHKTTPMYSNNSEYNTVVDSYC
jgi:DNA repair protein RadC